MQSDSCRDITNFLYIMLQAPSGNLNEEKYTDAAINAGIIFALAVAKVSYSLGYF